MSDLTRALPPLAFRILLAVLLIALGATALAAPDFWHASRWTTPTILAVFSLEWIIWPTSMFPAQPGRARAVGFFLLAIFAAILIFEFLSE